MKNSFNPFDQITEELISIQTKLDSLKSKLTTRVHQTKDPDTLLTTDQVCKLLNISRVTAWSWEKKNLLKPVKVGNLKRFRLSDIQSITQSETS